MSTKTVVQTLIAIGLSSLPCSASAQDSAGFVRMRPDDVQWRPVAGSPGVEQAVIAGDPKATGLYVIRVKFPPFVMDRPHSHPNDRYVTVLKGTWYTGTGDVFDPSKAVPLKAGSFMFHPAHAVHWDGSGSNEDVIVQVTGLGPADPTPVPKSAVLGEGWSLTGYGTDYQLRQSCIRINGLQFYRRY